MAMFSLKVVKVYDMTGDDCVYLVLHLRHPERADKADGLRNLPLTTTNDLKQLWTLDSLR